LVEKVNASQKMDWGIGRWGDKEMGERGDLRTDGEMGRNGDGGKRK